MGVFVEDSVNETGKGTVPDVGVPVKSAPGAAPVTVRIVIESRAKIKREAHNTLRCTCFATIKKTTPDQFRYITIGKIHLISKKVFYFNF